MNSRLLHAAARGARIEFRLKEPKWFKCYFVPTAQAKPDYEYRIHLDDEHLAYGPVSTALREAAEVNVLWLQDCLGSVEQAVVSTFEEDGELGYMWAKVSKCSLMHKQLFLLILAEALADEGL